MQGTSIEIIATVIFAVAMAHTFLSNWFKSLGSRFPEGSVLENLFHMLGEVEAVFGIWAAVFLILMSLVESPLAAIGYAESLDFTEPMFVFVIMVVAATRPVKAVAKALIFSIARMLPLNREIAIFASCLVIGPLLGSFITEPAAMTLVALLLYERYFTKNVSDRFRYVTLGALFVNVSIGGVLTPYAAPPVLMVAGKWGFDMPFMLQTFGWKAVIAVTINAIWAVILLRKELTGLKTEVKLSDQMRVPHWLTALHLIFLGLIVLNSHHDVIFIGIFLLFLGVATITKEYQEELLLRQSLMVGFFLGGLVMLGGLQKWWLEPTLTSLSDLALYLGATALTAVTDNAALTYLGSQVEGVSDGYKYALVAGAVTGGGLTVIANAPNPAGFSILQDSFGPGGISHAKLFYAALFPTASALAAFLIFWP